MCIRCYNCYQTGKCVYLPSIGVKIEHIVGGQNQECFFFFSFLFFFFFLFFQNAYLMVMPAETWATTKVNIAKKFAFVHRNLMVYTENYIKLIFVANSVKFVIYGFVPP